MSGLPTVTCPACQTEMGLEALLGTDDARGVVELMARMPGSPALRKGLLRYVGLFAPAKQRLRWGRAEALLTELQAMMDAGRIERNGRTWPAPLDYWQMALDAVLANTTLRRPLKSHGYLLEILAGLADKAEARQEQDRLTRGRGETPVGGTAPATPAGQAAGPAVGPASAGRSSAAKPRTPMPQSVKDILKSTTPKGEPQNG
jgi:hypothetical protein